MHKLTNRWCIVFCLHFVMQCGGQVLLSSCVVLEPLLLWGDEVSIISQWDHSTVRTAFEDDGSDCMGFMLFFPACHGLHWIDNISTVCVYFCYYLYYQLLLLLSQLLLFIVIVSISLHRGKHRSCQSHRHTSYYITLCFVSSKAAIEYINIHITYLHIYIYIYICVF